jgi:hypothetical protein
MYLRKTSDEQAKKRTAEIVMKKEVVDRHIPRLGIRHLRKEDETIVKITFNERKEKIRFENGEDSAEVVAMDGGRYWMRVAEIKVDGDSVEDKAVLNGGRIRVLRDFLKVCGEELDLINRGGTS